MHLRRTLACACIAAQAALLLVAAGLLGLLPGLRPHAAGAETLRHVSLLAAGMQPVDATIEYDNASSFLTTLSGSRLGSTSYIGPLNLPDGATVAAVRCDGTDTDPSNEFVVRMYRYRLSDEPDVRTGVTGFASSEVLFAGGDKTVEPDVDPAAARVDNAEYSYAIVASLPKASTSKILGLLRCVVDITYNTAFLPTAQRHAGQ